MCLFHCSTFWNRFVVELKTSTISLPLFCIFDYTHQWLTWERGYRKTACLLFHGCSIHGSTRCTTTFVQLSPGQMLKPWEKKSTECIQEAFLECQVHYQLLRNFHRATCCFLFQGFYILKLQEQNTLKVLIGIAPTGAITFTSKAWTGGVSDKVTTQKCGLLDHLEYGDVILADQGFIVHDELALVGARLEMPHSLKEDPVVESWGGEITSTRKDTHSCGACHWTIEEQDSAADPTHYTNQ